MNNRRTRETRKTVRIGVRVRTEAGWRDAILRNVSSRGMMLQTDPPLHRNQCVEIARGRARVIGRVVWSDDASSGLMAQDAVDIAGLLAAPGTNPAPAPAERRSASRPAASFRPDVALDRAIGSRLTGRAMERVGVLLAFASVSILAVTSALEAAEQPLESIRTALATAPA